MICEFSCPPIAVETFGGAISPNTLFVSRNVICEFSCPPMRSKPSGEPSLPTQQSPQCQGQARIRKKWRVYGPVSSTEKLALPCYKRPICSILLSCRVAVDGQPINGQRNTFYVDQCVLQLGFARSRSSRRATHRDGGGRARRGPCSAGAMFGQFLSQNGYGAVGAIML